MKNAIILNQYKIQKAELVLLSGPHLSKRVEKENTNNFVSFDCINKRILSSRAQFNYAFNDTSHVTQHLKLKELSRFVFQ